METVQFSTLHLVMKIIQMKLKIAILFSFLLIQFYAVCQEYNVTGESLNKAINISERAVELINNQNVEEALPLLNQAIEIAPSLREPYLYYYRIALTNSKHLDFCIDKMKKAKQIFQEDDELCYYLGEMYRKKGELKRAMVEYSTAIAYSKKNGEDFYLVPHYYFNRANISLKNNLFNSAVLDYTYAIKLKPNYGIAYVNRGICWFQKGDKESACKDWQSAVDLGAMQAEEYLERNCKEQ